MPLGLRFCHEHRPRLHLYLLRLHRIGMSQSPSELPNVFGIPHVLGSLLTGTPQGRR